MAVVRVAAVWRSELSSLHPTTKTPQCFTNRGGIVSLWSPNAGPADDASALIEGFVQELTPAVTNSTHAYNLWNYLASNDGAMRRALEWAWRTRDEHRARQEPADVVPEEGYQDGYERGYNTGFREGQARTEAQHG